jgi:hypothetical protein
VSARRHPAAADAGRQQYRSWRSTLGSAPLLDSAALASILAAPGHAIRAEPRVAVERTLNELTIEFFHLAFAATASADELQEVRNWLAEGRRIEAKLAHLASPMPRFARAYERSVEAGLEAQEQWKRKGAPRKQLLRYAVPRLLVFFELAFGLEAWPGASDPTGARDSPAACFLRRYLRVVLDLSKRATGISEAEQEQFIRAWTAPSHIASLIRRCPIVPEPSADAVPDMAGLLTWPGAKLLGHWGVVLKTFLDAGGDAATAVRAPAEVKEIKWGEYSCFTGVSSPGWPGEV